MIKSMTGYGKEVLVLPDKKITIELRSLNSKQFDFNARIPSFYREKEQEMRQMITNSLLRGKVDFFIHAELTGATQNHVLNNELAIQYYKQLKNLESQLENPGDSDYMALLMRMPDVLQTTGHELDDEEWMALKSGLQVALEAINRFREQEGESLYHDIKSRIHKIEELLVLVEPHEEQRILNIRQKLEKEVQSWIEAGRADQNRFEQELIYYLEKYDITEEKVRLKRHCEYFLETLDMKDSQGKKLGFIGQEIGREINTMGSKANESNIQKIVVQMKDELEKIKEQLANIL
ncbi:MAG: YicC family protein [Marinilabiliales bacterium]|nr:MAG: YicC family protein [Marinilabiliales bacterium]